MLAEAAAPCGHGTALGSASTGASAIMQAGFPRDHLAAEEPIPEPWSTQGRAELQRS